MWIGAEEEEIGEGEELRVVSDGARESHRLAHERLLGHGAALAGVRGAGGDDLDDGGGWVFGIVEEPEVGAFGDGVGDGVGVGVLDGEDAKERDVRGGGGAFGRVEWSDGAIGVDGPVGDGDGLAALEGCEDDAREVALDDAFGAVEESRDGVVGEEPQGCGEGDADGEGGEEDGAVGDSRGVRGGGFVLGGGAVEAEGGGEARCEGQGELEHGDGEEGGEAEGVGEADAAVGEGADGPDEGDERDKGSCGEQEGAEDLEGGGPPDGPGEAQHGSRMVPREGVQGQTGVVRVEFSDRSRGAGCVRWGGWMGWRGGWARESGVGVARGAWVFDGERRHRPLGIAGARKGLGGCVHGGPNPEVGRGGASPSWRPCLRRRCSPLLWWRWLRGWALRRAWRLMVRSGCWRRSRRTT